MNETLTADTSAIRDDDGLSNVSYSYKWTRINDDDTQTEIANATSLTYRLTEDDVEKRILLSVTFTDDLGNDEGPLSSVESGTVVPANLLVRNTHLTSIDHATLDSTYPKHAQQFTTGSDAMGYQLDSISFLFNTINDTSSAGYQLAATINAESSGLPEDVLCTLIDPPSFQSAGLHTFTVPTTGPGKCPKLTANTNYFAVMERQNPTSANIFIAVNASGDESDGSAPEWSIDDTGHLYTAGNTPPWAQRTSPNNLLIDIRGKVATDIEVPRGWSLTPDGLVQGDKFRLLFITYTGYSSSNTDIENYNAYVQSQANAGNAHAAIKPYSYWFRVLGSTEDVSARDNTMTTGTGVPIYWMGGDKVADNYGDFYDGSWDSEMSSGRAGIPSSSAYALWTGTENNGTRASANGVYQTLGTASVRIGSLNGSGDPLSSLNTTPGTNYHYYALSGIFIAPNTDATGQPAISGTPRVNETLSVDTSGITDPEGTANADFTYQWIRVDGSVDAEISGATNATYRLTNEDADKQTQGEGLLQRRPGTSPKARWKANPPTPSSPPTCWSGTPARQPCTKL